MKLINEKTDKEGYFSIGYHEETGKYIMVVIQTWGTWYSQYFQVPEKVYTCFETHIQQVRAICNTFRKRGINHKNFLYSEKEDENRTLLAQNWAELFRRYDEGLRLN